MIETKCKWCEKPMRFNTRTDVRKFCSRQCFRAHREKTYTIEDNIEVVLPPLEDITDDGFMALVEAIVTQAKNDVMISAPGTPLREEVEAFFMSEHFYELTNLDGFDILCRLQDQYAEKQRKKEEKKAHVSASV